MSNCPSCNSSNTKTLSMVWSGGTRNGKSGFGGVGVSSSGRITVGGGKGSSTSQSNLAASCAPPKKGTSAILIAGALFVMFWLPLLGALLNVGDAPNFFHGFFTVVLLVPLLLLMGYGLIRLYKHLDKSNKERMQNYSRSWICLRCGARFIPYRHSEEDVKAIADKMAKELKDLLNEKKAP